MYRDGALFPKDENAEIELDYEINHIELWKVSRTLCPIKLFLILKYIGVRDTTFEPTLVHTFST